MSRDDEKPGSGKKAPKESKAAKNIETDEEMDGPASLPILPLRNAVLFPSALMPIVVGRPKTLKLLKHAELHGGVVGVLTQIDREVEDPGWDDFYEYGTAARILKVMSGDDDDTFHVIVQGVRRFKITGVGQVEPFLIFDVDWVPDFELDSADPETLALARSVKETGKKLISLIPELPEGAAELVGQIDDPSRLLYLVMAHLGVGSEEKVQILSEPDLASALRQTLELLHHQGEVLRLSQKINREVRGEMDRNQRGFVLRQQLKAIQRELGEIEGGDGDAEEFEERLAEKELPQEVRKAVDRELRRFHMLQPASPEYSVSRTWLEWIADLPFNEQTEDRLDTTIAREVLDEDHYGLDKVKKRIVEFLAVRKLNPDIKGPILCLVGPPGVGKTSLGRSVARAMNREFSRASLGGIRDEAEIRGHRRTYVGALPGKIIQQLRRMGVRNPVMMLDEVDKLGHDWRGDPSSALLEVLDPEQNDTFMDHYLDVPFDLSKVLFIATANQTDTIPRPLLDRMELIEIPGYTHHEKANISRRHLIPRQVETHGLGEEQVDIPEDVLGTLITRYTREAGVRTLERTIGAVCRGVAVKVVEGLFESGSVSNDDLKDYLGPERYEHEQAERLQSSGVATGMAWTASGGDILMVEAKDLPGKGKFKLTGNLGDVMKESAELAISLVKADADAYGFDPKKFLERDLHLHVPSGAIPKDGPSAGITMYVSLFSLLSGSKVRGDRAMTGEISLRGAVLPVGGIKEKVLAALRSGVKEVVLPEKNRKDLQDIPEEVQEKLKFHFISKVQEILPLALKTKPKRQKPGSYGSSSAAVN